MRILTVAAHPDDETLGAGGTMALLAARGHEVHVLILSDGVTSRHRYIELQKECAVRANDILGVQDVTFCNLPDQGLDGMPLLDVIRPIEKVIGEFAPNIVFCPFRGDANQDHRAAFQATLVAARPVDGTSIERFLCYEVASSTEWAGPFADATFMPNVFVEISSTLETKLEAMQAYSKTHSNEMRPFPHPRSAEALEAIARRHGSASGVLAAEPFMLVRQVVRHEASIGVAL